jgi:hypothetical protein
VKTRSLTDAVGNEPHAVADPDHHDVLAAREAVECRERDFSLLEGTGAERDLEEVQSAAAQRCAADDW